MLYPTVMCHNGRIHAVKDQTSCICGVSYQIQHAKNQREILKSIHFRHIHTIDCRKCKSKLSEMVQIL
ncbi:hypothetical protein J2Z40_000464 [Cytobacillus eiseniae]|uniref:Uncharacterized protein n=1 Tax=Cytobacillus eiseniae TaxID=762947 RepID=A0ABS4RAI7_9BACI|nr:hypothetical protein [Cytobacillus eiseniae]